MSDKNFQRRERSFLQLGIKARLWLLMAISLAASLLLVGNAQVNIGAGGQAAYRVFTAKDATADILPPPMYVVGVRLIVSQVLEGTMPIDEATSEFTRQRREYDERVAYWSSTEAYGLDAHLLGAQHEKAERFMSAVRTDILAPVKEGRLEDARAALPRVHEMFLEHRREVDKTVETSVAFANDEAKSFDATNARMTQVNLILLAVAAGGLALAFAVVIRTIWRSIGAEPEALAEVAHSVAEGDLTRGIATDVPDSVAGSLETMRNRLRALVSVADESARQVVSAASEISAGNNDLSERTNTLAMHVQLFRDNMDNMTQSIRHESGVAHEADALAREASEITRSGGQIVAEVVARMKDISNSSEKIGEIISVINSIAFQTNILALNAAVEAARAGEQGRGFAVVAAEVRQLAGRSSKASQEIAGLIHESTASVEGGMGLVERAGSTMEQIVREFERVSSLISRITSDTESQTGDVDSILSAMSMIDDMNQQNAALVEQASAASASLKDQAERLAESVGVFRY